MNKTVIIGGVAGGATAAARLRRLDEDAEIVILERSAYVSYANCGLPYHLGGVISDRDDLIIKTAEDFLNRYNIEVRLLQEAQTIDRVGQSVLVKDLATGALYDESYDNLIIATGAKATVPEADADARDRVFTLQTMDDMDRILVFIKEQQPQQVAILGGGFIGIEAAENLVNLGLQVSIIQRSNQILPPLDPEMSILPQAELTNKGVSLLLDSPVSRISRAADGINIELMDGSSCMVDFIIAAIGVRPENTLAVQAGLDIGEHGGILTDEHMRTSDPRIFAVGDVVEVHEYVSQNPSLIALAGPATKQARIAADNIYGIESTYQGTQGSQIIKVFDLAVASTGINEKQAISQSLDYDKIYFSASNHADYYPGSTDIQFKVLFLKSTGKILGAQVIGYEGVDKRCDVLATAIRAGMTGSDLGELQLCYAPPFSSAKDPINTIGYMIENLLTGKLLQFHWHDVDQLPTDGTVNLIDVRTPSEYDRGHVFGFVNIPVDDMRRRIDEIDASKHTYLICQQGVRSYTAARILAAHGIKSTHLCGGYRFYSLAKL
ncbi:MAG: FAD-dependent oxidoreductase [Coriobacteriia bacterium]|nr:FAD-dependent oxidoreductase [Coriobacteriia bacterium]